MPVFVAQLVRGLLTLALAFGVAACDSPTTPSVPIDQQVTMAPGEQVQVTDTSLRIRFEGVVNDSRCPIDAICVLGGYPDHSAWTKGHHYYDPEARPASPVWFMVDIGFVERFPAVVSLETLKATKGLERMMVTQKGSRLSVQPCTKAEYAIVARLGRKAVAVAGDAPARARRVRAGATPSRSLSPARRRTRG